VYPLGTVLLCENGHEVCETIRDLTRADINGSVIYNDLWPTATGVGKWRPGQTPPKFCEPMPPLKCWCGGSYMDYHDGKFKSTRPNDLTRQQLKALMIEFIATEPNNDKDDWYMTSRGMAERILTNFAESLGINLEETSSATLGKLP
jgi:hypothetical protein